MRSLWPLLAVVVVSSVSRADEQAITVIPIDTVWAHDMPGTLDIHELEKEHQKKFPPLGDSHETMLELMVQDIKSRRGHRVGKVIVAQGAGVDAYRNVFYLFTDQFKKPYQIKEGEVSLFFYTTYSGRYIHLKEIFRSDSKIQIRYEAIPHRTMDLTMHVALVPLGNLPPGEYDVEISNLPLDEKSQHEGLRDVDDRWKSLHVSSSCSFRVYGSEEESP